MGIPIMILGQSGTGKSTSLRNFKPDEIGVINVSGKPLPFKSKLKTIKTDKPEDIEKVIRGAKAKTIVIDDAQYIMANEFMRRAKENGYQKFVDIGRNFWAIVNAVIRETPDDTNVYFLMHTEMDANGNEKAKTIGKMLDEKITLEGMFTIVLKTAVKDGNYVFLTQNSGTDTVKSPMGMFKDMEIPNDLKLVDTIIREYYDMNDLKEEA